MLNDPQFTFEPVLAVLQWIRELAVIGVIIVFGWRARGVFEYGKNFSDDIRKHMKRMDSFAVRVEANHLRHIEQYLYHLAKNRNITVDPESQITVSEATELEPPEDVTHP
jgi:hypothetical protein